MYLLQRWKRSREWKEGCLPSSSVWSHYMQDQVCTVPHFCTAASARALWRAVILLISASLVDNAVHEVMKHRDMLPFKGIFHTRTHIFLHIEEYFLEGGKLLFSHNWRIQIADRFLQS